MENRNLTQVSAEEHEPAPIPPYGLRRLLHTVGGHFTKLLLANVLTVICSIPIVTIPAALAGLHAVVQQYYRKGYGDVFSKFFGEFKANFFSRLFIAAVLAVLPVGGWFLGAQLSDPAAVGICAFFVVLDLLVYGWWFPQIALLKLSPGQALRNAFLMIFIATKENVLLLVLSGLTIILNTLLWPVSLIPIAIFAPSLFVLLTADIVNPVLDKRIIGPAAEAEAADQQA